MKTVSILVADAHQIVITGIRLLLKEHFENTSIDGITNANRLLNILKEMQYDLIILDTNMPGTDMHNLVLQVKHVAPNIKILIFSTNAEEVFARRYLKLGVNGYLLKNAPEAEIVNAVTQVLNGGQYVSANMLAHLSQEEINGKTADVFGTLSKREFEIMKYLIKGLGVKEISGMLNVHHSTVSTHKANIYEKTGATNIVELKELADLHS